MCVFVRCRAARTLCGLVQPAAQRGTAGWQLLVLCYCCSFTRIFFLTTNILLNASRTFIAAVLMIMHKIGRTYIYIYMICSWSKFNVSQIYICLRHLQQFGEAMFERRRRVVLSLVYNYDLSLYLRGDAKTEGCAQILFFVCV